LTVVNLPQLGADPVADTAEAADIIALASDAATTTATNNDAAAAAHKLFRPDTRDQEPVGWVDVQRRASTGPGEFGGHRSRG
jgi:hypothetical protein